MDPLSQLCQKLNAERTHQTRRPQQQPTPETAPPPYAPSEADDNSEEEDDDDDENASSSPSPLKLTINAAHSIQGSNNLVPTTPSPLADATRFSTILLAAAQQLNNATGAASSSRKRALKVDLTINCGVTVVGDRNVVGPMGLKRREPAQAVAGPGAVAGQGRDTVAGAKRKADGNGGDGLEPAAKRMAV